MMYILFLIFFCLMPWAHFFFKRIDLWHAQGHFFQLGILILFCYSFIEKPKDIFHIKNIPLSIFTLWIGSITGYYWYKIIVENQHYPVKIFFPFFNFLCFVWFYKLSLEYLNKEKIKKILEFFSYSIIVILFYCVLQYLHLDQFFKGTSGHDELVGTIGNTSFLAGFLAIIQPIFFNKKIRDILTLSLLWLIILLCNSASGLFCASIVVLFYLILKKKWNSFFIVNIVLILFIIFSIYKYPNFLSTAGRFEIWRLAFDKLKNKIITGFGLGSFALMKFSSNNTFWQHLHNEWYQVGFELGIVGLGFLIWCIWDYFKKFISNENNLINKLVTIFFGFCFLSLFTFPAHLWLIAFIGIFSYSFPYIIGEKYNENST